MHVFIVHAHPELKSFNAGLTQHAIASVTGAGHSVEVSDLYQMRFDPRSDRSNFTTTANADFYDQQKEEVFAVEHGGLSPSIAAELEKIRRADLLVFQFPLWWFSMPAILKGWVDRVFVMGAAYGHGKMYHSGVFRGKRAMLSLTTGGPREMYNAETGHGTIEQIVFPIQHGILEFCGFEALPPFVAYGIHRISEQERAAYLEQYAKRLLEVLDGKPTPGRNG